MPKQQNRKSGGDRKHGRKKRKPAQKRCTNELRWIKNKKRKIAKYKRLHPNWSQ